MERIKSVYQSKEYQRALKHNDEKIVSISNNFFAIKKIKKIPFLGERIILEARGRPSRRDLENFKDISREYYYGLISPTVIKIDKRLFEKEKFRKISNYTLLIDLKKTEDELWKCLEKKSARWGVKTAKKHNLQFIPSKEYELNEFYKLYIQTAKKGGFKAKSREFLRELRLSQVSKLFVIKKDKKVVCGGLILIDKINKYSILDLTASSEQGLKLQAMTFLYWNLILYSKKEGLDYFDLGGYDMEARKKSKTYNINKFKQRFGGKIIEQPFYSTNRKYLILRKIYKFLKKAK